MNDFSRFNRDFHTPVLPDEVISGLRIKPAGKYIDATAGGGGHLERILELDGSVLGIDQDQDAILHLKKKFESKIKQGSLVLAHGNFAQIGVLAQLHGFEEVDGILFDLGVSSYQIDASGRGFSFQKKEKLDMRMDAGTDLTAEEIVNTWSVNDLYEIFAKYGEERRAMEVAQEIVTRRRKTKIETTTDLAKIVTEVIHNSAIHPATKVFQALRIAVNDEMGNLKVGLSDGFKLLSEQGRLEVISFHSLEDRIAKLYFLELSRAGKGTIIDKKPIIAGFDEVRRNRRSRSAKLRIIARLG